MNEVKKQSEPQTGLDRLGYAIDRFVLAIAPTRGARRIATRHMLKVAEERAGRIAQTGPRNAGFEGARTDRLRGDRWLGSKLSPDSDLEDDLQTLRDRTNELYKNDSIGGAIESRVTHVVGSGMKFQSRLSASDLGIGEEQAKALQKQIESLVRKVSKRIDRDRVRPLWMTERLFERNVANDGECFIVLSDIGHADMPIPFCLEVISADRVETPPSESGNPLVRLGIEKDSRGVIVAYHVRKSHPGDTINSDQRFDRIPAARMIHVFEQLLAGQSRGLPWLHRVLNRIRDAKDLDEATIISAQVQACFSAFIKNTLTPGSTAAINASNGSPNSRGQLLQELEPATVKYLDDGQDVEFANPSQPGGNYGPFMQWTYQRIAAGLNWAYQLITKDWSGLSFAGGRLVLSEVKIDTRCRQQMLIDLAMCRIAERIIDEGVILGVLPIDPRAYEADPDLYRSHTWTPQAWAYAINPGEEVKANQLQLDGNMATLADILAADGKDLEETLDQRQREIQMQKDREILPLEATGAPPPEPAMQDTGAAFSMSEKRFFTVNAKGDEAELLIYEEIGEGWFGGVGAKGFAEQVKSLGKGVKTINVRINSVGGNAFDGATIYNTLKNHPAKVRVHIDGAAISAASQIAMAGDEIEMATNAVFMAHKASGGVYGKAEELRNYADLLDKVNDGLIDVYATRTGKSRDQITAWLDEEKWFGAQEAVDAGFATSVSSSKAIAATFNPKSFPLNYQNVPDWCKEILRPAPDNQVLPPKEPEKMAEQDTPNAKAEEILAKQQKAADDAAAAKLLNDKARDEGAAAGVAAENKRVTEIAALCETAKMPGEAKALIADNKISVEDARKHLFEAMCKSRPAVGDEGGEGKPKDENAAYKKEYAENKAYYAKTGTSEEQYVRTRRIDDGLDPLVIGKAA